MEFIKKYKQWIHSEALSDDEKKQLIMIEENNNDIKECFYHDLEFGTGGLRGIIGLGTNRINTYTIRKTTQGLANYLKNNLVEKSIKVAIAYDSRHFSGEFALEAALVLVANDIKVFLFDELRPTPELSFAVREKNCDAGIVITASHNPSQYNGYKVYGADGGQITLKAATLIQSEIRKLDIFNDVKICSENSLETKRLLSLIGKEIDEKYLEKVIQLAENLEVDKNKKDLRIVYTPLHGTGLKLIQSVLSMLKYNNVFFVESQCKPDGNFPTVKTPNPEEKEALSEGIKLAEKLSGDIVLGTDPDADRVGVAVKNKAGKYILLSGNQIGSLLTHYIVSNKVNISKNHILIKTIVTSDLGANIAKAYGATVINTLTGFKFIGEKIKEFENQKDKEFLFGYEESYGYLAGTFVRDKDAIISSVLIVEMATYYKSLGKNLLDALNDIHLKYGYYNEELRSILFNGIEAQEKSKKIVDKFRDLDSLNVTFSGISFVEDYSIQERINNTTFQKEKIDLPSSNVLKICFSDESWFAIRPSGTEPKLKVYFSTNSSLLNTSEEKMIKLIDNVNTYIKINSII